MPMQVAEGISLSEAKTRRRGETYNVEAKSIIVTHYRTYRKKGSLVGARLNKSQGTVLWIMAACKRKHEIEGRIENLTLTLGTCKLLGEADILRS